MIAGLWVPEELLYFSQIRGIFEIFHIKRRTKRRWRSRTKGNGEGEKIKEREEEREK